MGVFQKGSKWYIDYYVNGCRKRECIGPDKKLAQTVLAKRQLEHRRGHGNVLLHPKAWENLVLHEPLPAFQERQLYFIRCGDAVKIGVSGNPATRLKELQTGAPGPLMLLASIKRAGHLEHSCHRRLAHLHISGEWFRYDAAIEQLIAELLGTS